MTSIFSVTGLIFLATIIATFAMTFLARSHAKGLADDSLHSQKLNKWLIGLSAGATANSGFIVTAAVGLGYLYGAQWILLPIAWFIGDLVFWKFFPSKINESGREIGAKTITDIVVAGFGGRSAKVLTLMVGILILAGLTSYTSAQWLAGQKFVQGAFGLSPHLSLSMFALVIIAYTTIGGFRGSIYADSLQAIIRVIGTFLALAAVGYVAFNNPTDFEANIGAAGEGFLNIFSMGSIFTILAFIVGYAAASLGFGLGQPQLITRYMGGASPKETQSAQWIYIAFVQFTWIAMTTFGVLLRGVMPGLEDPEMGLSIFITSNFGALIAGLILADIFATIAATSNSLLVAMSQSLKSDILSVLKKETSTAPFWALTFSLGIFSMLISLNIKGTVLTFALASISYLGAALAPSVMIRLLKIKASPASLLATICIGILTAFIWRKLGYSAIINESAPGIVLGLVSNFVVVKFTPQSKSNSWLILK